MIFADFKNSLNMKNHRKIINMLLLIKLFWKKLTIEKFCLKF